MVDKWSSTTVSSSNGESGILRKSHQNNINENREDLLVFGYACKIFRDDEKAQYIDQGKHLIPWMGDQSLKIDRYDVRATLHDLAPYEPPPGGYTNRTSYLSTAEQKAEALCEEERYYSLYHNEMEEQLYLEEEQKRATQQNKSSFGQVNFNYDSQNKATTADQNDINAQEESDEAFIPLENFPIPSDIELPNTLKEHAIIEKTAKFISTQGAQMEILLKTKQANNPQFDFLVNNGKLNKYYRHVLDAIKSGTYPSKEVEDNSADKTNTLDEQNNGESTQNTNLYSLSIARPTLSTIPYKPSASCAYTKLISKIKGVPIPSIQSSDKSDELKPQQILNSNRKDLNIDSGESSRSSTPTQQTQQPQDNELSNSSNSVEIKKISTGLMLAQYYNSDSDSENGSSESGDESTDFPIPSEILRNIIDKTAMYVIKNGKSFENILKTKDPQRFSFLDNSNEYHYYYLYKVTGKKPKVDQIKFDNSGKSKTITPVSFSIKSKDEQTISSNPILLREQSSEEDNDEKEISNSNNLTNDSNKIPLPDLPNTTVNNKFDENLHENYDSHKVLKVESDFERRDKEAKRLAEDKLRDRLAAAAREKLGLLSKEKQLQLERKKKAMAFLTQIKSQNVESKVNTIGEEHRTYTPCNYSSDNESVHSIPTNSPIRSPSQSNSRRKRSRSRSRSKSRSRSRSKHKKKKSKSSHSKKKSKSKSRTRTRSQSRENKKHKSSYKERSHDKS